ncbi:hypothetical protein [Xylella fastidiosa]|uniref:hypothetical protein n=1 Tax=Xylella fastidiosa TaxID=2371 RepID=UPI003984CA53
MAKKWSEVASSPQYMALSPQEREEARNEYFNHVVAPNVVNQEELAEVRRAFDTDTAPKQQQQGRASGGPVHPASPVDQAAIARQVYDDSPGINALHRRWRGNEPHRARPPAADYR